MADMVIGLTSSRILLTVSPFCGKLAERTTVNKACEYMQQKHFLKEKIHLISVGMEF